MHCWIHNFAAVGMLTQQQLFAMVHKRDIRSFAKRGGKKCKHDVLYACDVFRVYKLC